MSSETMTTLPEKKKHNLLIVDDNSQNIKIISTLLYERGFNISIATNGYQAIESLKYNSVDLILLDVMMPEMDGYETCKRLKSDDETKDIPVIFTSALSETIDKVKAFNAGAVDYVTKPIELEEILARINTHIKIRELQKNFLNLNKNLEREVAVRTKELKESTTRFRSLIETISDWIWEINEENIFTYSSPRVKDLLGYDPSEVLGKSIFAFLPDDQFKTRNLSLLEMIGKREGFARYQKKLVHKTGDIVMFETSAVPILDANGNFCGFRGVNRDITERVKIEAQLLQVQKMETVGTLAGGFAHDFNNLLGAMMASTSVMKSRIENNMDIEPETLSDYIETMSECSDRGADITKQLLSLSRKQELKLGALNLNTAIENVVKICKMSFNKSIGINVKYAETTPIAKADATSIEQVLLNLCVNAEHAMTIMRSKEKWGGDIEISISKKRLDSLFCLLHPEAFPQDYWIISVLDTGIGMDDDTISNIFNPFYTTKPVEKGTGLGLSMVYNILMQHQGFVDVNSEVGQGSVFNIYLPVYNNSEVDDSISDDDDEISEKKGKVLVIDDEKIIRQSLASMLEECGLQVITARSGVLGLDIYSKNHHEISMVILDLNMPEMSGAETFEKLCEINSDVRVLLISGSKESRHIKSLLNKGVKGFLAKPFSLKPFSSMVKKVLKQPVNI